MMSGENIYFGKEYELRECPCCGGEAKLMMFCEIRCQTCRLTIVRGHTEEVVAAWNRRAYEEEST